MEACIRFVKHTNKNALTLIDIHLALLQMCFTPIGLGFLSPVTMLFDRLIRDLLPQMNRDPIGINNDDTHYET